MRLQFKVTLTLPGCEPKEYTFGTVEERWTFVEGITAVCEPLRIQFEIDQSDNCGAEEDEYVACTCAAKGCKRNPCHGECGCEGCHNAYGDFLGSQGD